MTSTASAVSVTGLTKRYGSRAAVDDLTVDIPTGVVAGFIGPNGAGKTTTMAMLLGLVRPTSGGGTVLGQPLAHPQRYLGRVDAPTNGLDPVGITEMRDLIGRVAGGDRTVLVSSHLLGELEHVCDWLLII